MAPDKSNFPATAEQIKEWASLGPSPKGPPADADEAAARKERKAKRTALTKQFLTANLQSNGWTEKKVAAALDELMEVEKAAAAAPRPAYLDAPSGTRDFYPQDMRIRTWLFDAFRSSARAFGFQEYDAPVLEHVKLYERKAGEEIVDQMYNFKDKEGAHVTLRPEMTPTLARLVLNRTNLQTGEVKLEQGLPLRWFSIPQCWRFETTQRGRKREHYQWNMDIVGIDKVGAELELLAAACDFFTRVGLGPDIVGIKVNSRAVLEALLAKYGIEKGPQDYEGGDIFAKACVIIDKLDKIGPEAVMEQLAEIGVSSESSKDILAALEASSIEELANLVGGDSSPAIQQVKRLFELAEPYGISDYLVFDASVVRGLAYYTGIVWEAFDRKGELRAIMGGGRYDGLLELYGGKECRIPCVGFGFGDCVIMELLEACNTIPDFRNEPRVDYNVCAYSDDLYGNALKIAADLRKEGCSVELMQEPKKKVKKCFEYADKSGARRVVFVAPGEIEKGVVRIKDLRTKDPRTNEGIQIDCPLDQLNTIDELMAETAKAAEAEMAAKVSESEE